MADTSKIEWTDATFNPWIGCTKVSPACDNCYAESWAHRFGDVKWGNHPRRRTSIQNWNKVPKWNREADTWEAEHGRPRFVFCASLADVFDNQIDPQWRSDLWDLIRECDRLVWLLLTKRPQNIRKMLPEDWGNGWQHVWLGTTVENQEVADRNIPELLAAPAVKRFLSIEPIVGSIDMSQIPTSMQIADGQPFHNATTNCLTGASFVERPGMDAIYRSPSLIHWVITGGESGTNARPAHPDWYRSLRDQCQAANVPFHFKQWGEWLPYGYKDALGRECSRTMGEKPGVWIDNELYGMQVRVGKKEAGRLLDGRTWDERPDPARFHND